MAGQVWPEGFLELPVLVRQCWGFFSWVWGWVRPVNYSVRLPSVVLAQGGFHVHTQRESLQTRIYMSSKALMSGHGELRRCSDRLSLGPIAYPDLCGMVPRKQSACKWWRRSRCHAQFRLTWLSVTALFLKLSCLPQDCFLFSFFSFCILAAGLESIFAVVCKIKIKKTWQTRTKRPDVTRFSPRPVLDCEGSGKEKTCDGLEKKRKSKKGSGLWCWLSQTICQSAGVRTSVAKEIYFTAFHHFSNKKERKKNEALTVNSCFILFFSNMVSFAYHTVLSSISRMFFLSPWMF